MKVLLDENIPEELKADLSAHEVYSIREMGWKGKKNGELIQNLVKERFEILLTADKNYAVSTKSKNDSNCVNCS